MAIVQINRFYMGEETLINFMAHENYLQRGFYGLSFNNIGNNTKPTIQTNSTVEVNGELFRFNAVETITLTPSVGECYVKCYKSGSVIVAEMTSTAPTFNGLKNGWYSGDHRYVMRLNYDGTNYFYKKIMNKERYWLYEI